MATYRITRVYVNLTHTPNLLRPLLPAGTRVVELHEVAHGRTPGTDFAARIEQVLAKLDADPYLTDRAVCSAANALAKIAMKLYRFQWNAYTRTRIWRHPGVDTARFL